MILSESMRYLTMGRWWLALFPGLLLVFVVVLFHYIGDTLSGLISPGAGASVDGTEVKGWKKKRCLRSAICR